MALHGGFGEHMAMTRKRKKLLAKKKRRPKGGRVAKHEGDAGRVVNPMKSTGHRKRETIVEVS